MSQADPLLDVDGLSAGYGRIPVLREVSLTAGEAEIVGVLGHNGVGKSTLLRSLVGLVPASAGAIRWDGSDITRLPPHARAQAGIGYVPQGRGIFPSLTVRENLRFAYQDTGDGSVEELCDRILDSFPRLGGLMGRDGGALSGGEQQLLALARCLMGSPSLILLDEPTEGIQPSIVDEIAGTLAGLRSGSGLAVLLVEQNIEFISGLASRVLVLERGQVRAELGPDEIRDAGLIEEFLGFRRPALERGPVRPLPRKAAAPAAAEAAGARRAAAGVAGIAAPRGKAAAQGVQMAIKRPTLNEMRELAERLHLSMTDAELERYLAIMEPYLEGYGRLDASPDFLPQVRYPRSPGYRPSPDENPLNAWYYKTEIQGAGSGPLAGRRVAVKDTVCVAGVPMMSGSSIMEGYIPEVDATVVTRMLDAGAIIAGKATCEDMCLSGGSHTSATGPVHNPYKLGYMSGGSSSGSAALVAAGEVDMAIAGDQGGSIRIPSSHCGCFGMKPTYGLVPYSGIIPIERTIDHVGPVTRTVADNALLLEVIAGADGIDPRQGAVEAGRYTEALGRGARGMRIGILKEGFGRPESEPDVDAKVRAAAERFRSLSATVEEVSIPEHCSGPDLWTAIAVEGLQELMMNGNLAGANCRGLFLSSLSDHFAKWRSRADELSPSLKTCMFLGEYFRTRHRGRYYGKAQNLLRMLKGRYGAAFEAWDLLLMPTTPMKAPRIPPPDAPIELTVQRAFEMVGNTAPFNAGGFPAMTVPCGLSEGLPVGMMLVAPDFGEPDIYRAAEAFERLGDWKLL